MKIEERLDAGKQITIRLSDAIFAIVCFLILFASSAFAYRQAVKYDGRRGFYESDLPHYVKGAIESPNAFRMLRCVFSKLYAINGTIYEMAVYMGLMVMLIVVFNFILLKYLLRKTDTMNWIIQLSAITALFSGSIAVPGVHYYFYYRTFSKFAWHSPTQIAMTTFAILSVLLFFKLYDSYHERVSPWLWLGLSASFLASAWSKPSFAMVFFPIMLILLLVDLFSSRKCNDMGRRIKAFILLGTTVLPTCIYILILKLRIFADGSGRDVIVGGGGGFGDSPLIVMIILGGAFPLLVLAFNLKNLKDVYYSAMWGTMIFGFIEQFALGEGGDSANYGNFEWGRLIGTYLMFLASIYKFIDNCRDTSFLNGKTTLKKVYKIAGVILLALHVISNVYYVSILMLTGQGYMW